MNEPTQNTVFIKARAGMLPGMSDEKYAEMMYGDGSGNIPEEYRPKTTADKIRAVAKARLARAGIVAAMASVGIAAQHCEKRTIEIPELKRWEDTEPHSTEPLLKGRRGKKSRRQRKAGR